MKHRRNELCLCGSGKKHKKCCALHPAAGASSPVVSAWTAPGPETLRAPSTELTTATLGRLAAMIQAAQYEDLEKAAGELLIRQPNSAHLYKVLGLSLWMQGKDAVRVLEKATQLSPNDAEGHSNLGNALRRARRFEEAAASHRRAIAAAPQYAEAHNNLGSVLRDLGRIDEAVASYRRALAIRPGFALAHRNLGNVLHALGQLDDAAACYGLALQINPELFDVCSELGAVLFDLRQLDEAAARYRQAIRLRPDVADAHYGLGNVLVDLGRFGEAVASYRRALALKPDFADAHNNLGVALRQQNQIAAAETSCRAALAIDPGAIGATLFLAQLQADKGLFTEAEELFERAISIQPDLAEAWAGIAGVRKMTSNDAVWLLEAQRIAGSGLPPRREVHLRYAIGKYFDDVGDFEQAFVNYERANRLTKLHIAGHDRLDLAHAVDWMIQHHDRQWIERAQCHANASYRPLFIVGMPRSGTTLAEQILASHPAVFGAGELSFWIDAGTTHASAAREAAMPEGFIGSLADDYLRLIDGLSPDALHVVDKMPTNFRVLGLIHAALPNARIIHLQRDPIDTCLSIYFQNFQNLHTYATDLEDLAHYYTEYRRLMQHWRATLAEDAMLCMPYERLVGEPEVWIRKILNFAGLPWDPHCLDFHRTQRNITTFSKWQARQTINNASVGRWRNYERFIGPLLRLAELRYGTP